MVSPFTTSPRKRIVPAPRKPIPETTCAAAREGSSTTSFCPSTSEKPKAETGMIRQEPTLTSMCVRRPAAQRNRSRSNPIIAPVTSASTRRSTISP